MGGAIGGITRVPRVASPVVSTGRVTAQGIKESPYNAAAATPSPLPFPSSAPLSPPLLFFRTRESARRMIPGTFWFYRPLDRWTVYDWPERAAVRNRSRIILHPVMYDSFSCSQGTASIAPHPRKMDVTVLFFSLYFPSEVCNRFFSL